MNFFNYLKARIFKSAPPRDRIQKLDGATIQHGPLNQRIYLMKLADASPRKLLPKLETLAAENHYTKIFAKVPASKAAAFDAFGFRKEAQIPGFYNGDEAAVFLGKYYDPERKTEAELDRYNEVNKLAIVKAAPKPLPENNAHSVRLCTPADTPRMAEIYKSVFPSYPFPIDDPGYLRETMADHIRYFCVEQEDEIAALSSAETDRNAENAEMTDFATLPEYRGKNFAQRLLEHMERQMRTDGFKTAYTIARAISPGMNITFARSGYSYGGRLVNNTNIAGQIESMNVWYKAL